MKRCFICNSCNYKYNVEDLAFDEFIKQFPDALPHGCSWSIKFINNSIFYKEYIYCEKCSIVRKIIK